MIFEENTNSKCELYIQHYLFDCMSVFNFGLVCAATVVLASQQSILF